MEPVEWKSTGRQRLSSCSRLEFWKCATIAFLPWMRAYVMLHTCARRHMERLSCTELCQRPENPVRCAKHVVCAQSFITKVQWLPDEAAARHPPVSQPLTPRQDCP